MRKTLILSLLLVIPITGIFGQPTDLSGISFCIDPGHGGSQPGAFSPGGIPEKQVNLTVGLFLRDYLIAANADTVLMTRTTDISLTLSEREVIANNAGVDWFQSIHHNWASNPSTDYTLCLYSAGVSGPNFPGFSDIISDTIAYYLSIAEDIGSIGGRGDYQFYGTPNYLGVLNDLTMPGQLAEAFFMSNLLEDARMRNSEYLNTESECIHLCFLRFHDVTLPPFGTLVGTVRDSITNLPVVNARGTILETGDQYLIDGHGNGYFRFDSLAAGSYSLEVVSILDSVVVPVSAHGGQINHLRIKIDGEIYTEPQPPAPPVLKYILGVSPDTFTVAWYPSSPTNLGGYRLYHSYDGGNWSCNHDEEELTPSTTEISFGGFSPETLLYLKLTAVDTSYNPLESGDSDIYGVRLSSTGLDPVLIVDGFDRRASWYEAWHPFTMTHGRAISAAGISFNCCGNEAVIQGQVDLNSFSTVVWVLGDEGVADETFNAAEQNLVKNFLENGGKLFVSGSEVGYDLDRSTSSSSDRDFYNNYLKAEYDGDDSGDYTVEGVDNTIFSGLSFGYGRTSMGSPYGEDYPDYIQANGGSAVNLIYNAGMNAAVQYEGTFGSSAVPGKVVYIGFPFETIEQEEDRNAVMERVLNFFGYPVGIERLHDRPVVSEFRLYQNYPNPFNPETVIGYRLFAPGNVSLKIYNSLGEEIRVLETGLKPPGHYRVIWDGRDNVGSPVSSGIYFYRLESRGGSLQRRMVLIR